MSKELFGYLIIYAATAGVLAAILGVLYGAWRLTLRLFRRRTS